MMTCHQALDQLSLFLDGELPEPDATALESHLASCRTCRAKAIAIDEVGELLNRVGPVTPPAGLLASVLDRASATHGSRRRFDALASLVAAGLGALAVGLFWVEAMPARVRPAATTNLVSSLQTATGSPGIVEAELRRLQERPEGRLLTWALAQGEGR